MSRPEEEISGLIRQLVTLTRRVRINAGRLRPELSFVGYALLSQMAEHDGVRAGDLVELTGLNKSTISRQVADLQRAGLIVRELDPADSRVLLLRPSALGRELLAEADIEMRREVRRRTRDWTPEEVATLRALLTRYNAGPADEAPAHTTAAREATEPPD
ncbi:DNA-binding transcriptional regulator, MarR family [Streptoalloteichus tenebrarius]|uniref:DNA-binding transcriptional regulator, MarR family n=1 Tax=Streptoalloteichus tenebrarius (strain ATCC 17920 / DSM 40477 / JCM 4838 / CBS 697.72 / NBRC 16177 / NCIMB 11028 / NRRL B-12390 / A12253. 1 / ISP 5477) TaxID=1933 RepID=A0ABT1HWR4_STRSD|nr:MarR family transcriptional regulator [Streptoalloteichus tenebrarius]MCP2259835.1 DNA-binding transcriptional regulator, MarR family [Streptoalloteichus tenebrarius]BFE99215.1 hypothetical protein GCM10020241_08910 [Streptoalloteichus tenebrarius]